MKFLEISALPTDKAYLHFEATRIDHEQVQVDYELVIPLMDVDSRGTWDHKGRKTRPISHKIVWLDQGNNKRIPLGRTIVGTNNETYPFDSFHKDEIELPFRDGAHISWDAEKFSDIGMFYSMNGKYYKLG